VNKEKLVLQIIRLLEQESENLTNAAKATHADATNEESKAEHKYDTRSLEASYLAGAQAALASESKLSLAIYKKLEIKEFHADSKIALTAFIELVSDDGEHSFYFLGPNSGGIKIEHEGKPVVVITPPSPLGQKLIGCTVGDCVKIANYGNAREYEIFRVC